MNANPGEVVRVTHPTNEPDAVHLIGECRHAVDIRRDVDGTRILAGIRRIGVASRCPSTPDHRASSRTTGPARGNGPAVRTRRSTREARRTHASPRTEALTATERPAWRASRVRFRVSTRAAAARAAADHPTVLARAAARAGATRSAAGRAAVLARAAAPAGATHTAVLVRSAARAGASNVRAAVSSQTPVSLPGFQSRTTATTKEYDDGYRRAEEATDRLACHGEPSLLESAVDGCDLNLWCRRHDARRTRSRLIRSLR